MAAGLFLVIAVAATGAAFFAYTQRTLAENQRTLAEKQAIRATQQAMLADEQRARADAQMRLAEEANLRAGSSVSPDAERLLVLDADGRARIINLVTGQEIGRLAIDDGAITSAAFSPDGNKIVTTATNFDIGIWEAKTLKLLSILKGQATATRVVFSHDALLLASAGDENTVHLWSVATGEFFSRSEQMDQSPHWRLAPTERHWSSRPEVDPLILSTPGPALSLGVSGLVITKLPTARFLR